MIARAPPNETSNRRSFQRKAVRQPATVVHADQATQVRTWDISLDGMSLVTPRPMPPGRHCTVTFDIPTDAGDKTITAPLKIVYSSYTGPEAFKVGAVFGTLEADVADAINAFVSSP
ncbi:MAG TPA: PilZ domain-containing protein [Caldimonas sp.]|nr:PilZ domain-containing protein [Caldimonas sp.]HEX2542658.1 PilZ domain-containing protein [Caldimonas sp.]